MNGEKTSFSYHDLYKQVEDVEERLNEKFKGLENRFELFKNNDMKEVTKQQTIMATNMVTMETKVGLFIKLGYWILGALGANLVVFILHWATSLGPK